MAEGIVLVGGDEFRPGCEEMDRAILSAASGKGPSIVLVLPTAAVTGPQKAAADGVRHFSNLGAMARELMVLDRGHANDEHLIEAVSGASVVYFTGGSPTDLLAALVGSKLLAKLRAALAGGAVIGGSSAGAMVMGSAMRDPSSGIWVEGLGIAEDLAILPHHERSDPAQVAEELAETAPPDLRVLGIDARTCAFGTVGSWQVLGVGKVTTYHGGSWATYRAGETLPRQF